MINKILYWIPTTAYLLLIFFLSSRSPLELDISIKGFDKVLHMGEYTVVSFLIFFSLKKSHVKKAFFYAILLSTLYGISDEFHQSFVPNRSADVYDLLADFIGSIIGAFGGIVLIKDKKKGENSSPGYEQSYEN